MANRVIQTSMSAGEISESASSRIDLELFNKSLKLASNVYVNWTGNVVKREGSQMIAQDDNIKRIEGFMFNGEQKYLLAFKTTGIDVYYDGSVVATISQSFTTTQINEFKYAQSGDVFIIFHKSFAPMKIIRTHVLARPSYRRDGGSAAHRRRRDSRTPWRRLSYPCHTSCQVSARQGSCRA